MFARLLFGLAVVTAALAGVGAMLPDHVEFSRTTEIAASPERVFATVNGFSEIERWSPWHAADADADYRREGPPSGIGARFLWTGAQSGAGSQEIVESEPPRRVALRQMFGGGGPGAQAQMDFTITPSSNGAEVTWRYFSNLGANPLARWSGVFMKHQLGRQFETGLANLKTYLEGQTAEDLPPAFSAEILMLAPRPLLVASGKGRTDDGSASAALEEAYGRITRYMTARGLNAAGAPRAITARFDAASRYWEFEAAMPIGTLPAEKPEAGQGVGLAESYAGRVARFVHEGPYDGLAETYAKIAEYMAASGLKGHDRPWEEYITDPETTPPEELITYIYWPID